MTRTEALAPSERGTAFRPAADCLDENLNFRALPGDVVAVCPPLVVRQPHIEEMASKPTRGLDRTLGAARI